VGGWGSKENVHPSSFHNEGEGNLEKKNEDRSKKETRRVGDLVIVIQKREGAKFTFKSSFVFDEIGGRGKCEGSLAENERCGKKWFLKEKDSQKKKKRGRGIW